MKYNAHIFNMAGNNQDTVVIMDLSWILDKYIKNNLIYFNRIIKKLKKIKKSTKDFLDCVVTKIKRGDYIKPKILKVSAGGSDYVNLCKYQRLIIKWSA